MTIKLYYNPNTYRFSLKEIKLNYKFFFTLTIYLFGLSLMASAPIDIEWQKVENHILGANQYCYGLTTFESSQDFPPQVTNAYNFLKNGLDSFEADRNIINKFKNSVMSDSNLSTLKKDYLSQVSDLLIQSQQIKYYIEFLEFSINNSYKSERDRFNYISDIYNFLTGTIESFPYMTEQGNEEKVGKKDILELLRIIAHVYVYDGISDENEVPPQYVESFKKRESITRIKTSNEMKKLLVEHMTNVMRKIHEIKDDYNSNAIEDPEKKEAYENFRMQIWNYQPNGIKYGAYYLNQYLYDDTFYCDKPNSSELDPYVIHPLARLTYIEILVDSLNKHISALKSEFDTKIEDLKTTINSLQESDNSIDFDYVDVLNSCARELLSCETNIQNGNFSRVIHKLYEAVKNKSSIDSDEITNLANFSESSSASSILNSWDYLPISIDPNVSTAYYTATDIETVNKQNNLTRSASKPQELFYSAAVTTPQPPASCGNPADCYGTNLLWQSQYGERKVTNELVSSNEDAVRDSILNCDQTDPICMTIRAQIMGQSNNEITDQFDRDGNPIRPRPDCSIDATANSACSLLQVLWDSLYSNRYGAGANLSDCSRLLLTRPGCNNPNDVLCHGGQDRWDQTYLSLCGSNE